MDRVVELRDVNDPKCTVCIANPNFPCPGAYRIHGLPVVGISTALDLIELVAGIASRRKRKLAQVVQRAAAKLEWFRIDHF